MIATLAHIAFGYHVEALSTLSRANQWCLELVKDGSYGKTGKSILGRGADAQASWEASRIEKALAWGLMMPSAVLMNWIVANLGIGMLTMNFSRVRAHQQKTETEGDGEYVWQDSWGLLRQWVLRKTGQRPAVKKVLAQLVKSTGPGQDLQAFNSFKQTLMGKKANVTAVKDGRVMLPDDTPVLLMKGQGDKQRMVLLRQVIHALHVTINEKVHAVRTLAIRDAMLMLSFTGILKKRRRSMLHSHGADALTNGGKQCKSGSVWSGIRSAHRLLHRHHSSGKRDQDPKEDLPDDRSAIQAWTWQATTHDAPLDAGLDLDENSEEVFSMVMHDPLLRPDTPPVQSSRRGSFRRAARGSPLRRARVAEGAIQAWLSAGKQYVGDGDTFEDNADACAETCKMPKKQPPLTGQVHSIGTARKRQVASMSYSGLRRELQMINNSDEASQLMPPASAALSKTLVDSGIRDQTKQPVCENFSEQDATVNAAVGATANDKADDGDNGTLAAGAMQGPLKELKPEKSTPFSGSEDRMLGIHTSGEYGMGCRLRSSDEANFKQQESIELKQAARRTFRRAGRGEPDNPVEISLSSKGAVTCRLTRPDEDILGKKQVDDTWRQHAFSISILKTVEQYRNEATFQMDTSQMGRWELARLGEKGSKNEVAMTQDKRVKELRLRRQAAAFKQARELLALLDAQQSDLLHRFARSIELGSALATET
eukprot:gene14277-16886_t